jgi:hypothetical protein
VPERSIRWKPFGTSKAKVQEASAPNGDSETVINAAVPRSVQNGEESADRSCRIQRVASAVRDKLANPTRYNVCLNTVPVAPAMAALDLVAGLVQTVECETYTRLEALARQRIDRRDEDDWPLAFGAWIGLARFGPKTPISSAAA